MDDDLYGQEVGPWVNDYAYAIRELECSHDDAADYADDKEEERTRARY